MKYFLLFVTLLIANSKIYAQPEPCGPNALMTPLCNDACIICDIDGYSGINNDLAVGQKPAGFCTGTSHHFSWIAFLAGTTNLKLEFTVGTCLKGWGLEVGIYYSPDCKSFQLVSNCEGAMPPGSVWTFENTTPLVIGQYYYFVMDGDNDGVCSYKIKVLEGSTKVDPLQGSGVIIGDTVVCANSQQTYTAQGITGAPSYDWTVDGNLYDTGPQIVLSWPTAGEHEVCVQAYNVCDKAPLKCETVTVYTIPPTIIDTILCEGECLTVANNTICTAGNYSYTLKTLEGCDSTIQVKLLVNPISSKALKFNICDGDSVQVGIIKYFTTGNYTNVLKNQYNCDSTITLDLNVIICDIEGTTAIAPVKCFGENSGSIDFQVTKGTPPFTYTFQKIGDPGVSAPGNIAALFQNNTISGLAEGQYLINIEDLFSNKEILIASISEPTPLALMLSTSNYQGYSVRCFGGSDGKITSSVSGGIAGYQYTWSNGATSADLNDISVGTYTLTLTDANGCSIVESIPMISPDSMVVSAVFLNPNCDGRSTGAISIGNVIGGIPPYGYSFKGTKFKDDKVFPDLPGGNYNIKIQDSNECETEIFGTLVEPVIPDIYMPSDKTIELGSKTELQAYVNGSLDSIQWVPIFNLSCDTCLATFAKPYNSTQYYLRVVSIDGCIRMDSVKVTVDKLYNIYVPNAFSPNGDGENEKLVIYSNQSVKVVRNFSVYSRWGNLVYQGIDIDSNDTKSGWDGYFNGKIENPGTYVWFAEVEFLDGTVQILKGDLNLLR